MWNWTWVDDESSDEDSDGCTSDQVSDGYDSDSKSQDDNEGAESQDDSEELNLDEPFITHSVIFKCIGHLRELRYQEVLALAKKKMAQGINVPVKIVKEPNNPVDVTAIAFVCHLDKEWERIGYIVKEALNDVHCAKKISAKFDWIKLVFHFKKPGWYAGIMITRSGECMVSDCVAELNN